MATHTSISLAEDDLVWWFVSAAGEMGFRAQSYEPASGAAADPELAMLTDRRMRADKRFKIVAARVKLLRPDEYAIASAAFTPRRWPITLHKAFTPRSRNYTLAGLAITAPAAIEARDEHHAAATKRAEKKGDAAPRLETITEFLVWRAQQNDERLRGRIMAQITPLVERVVAAYGSLMPLSEAG